ncbi:D-alanyl-D-alanine carboxypeptidase family protein [Roseateles sp.]|uniref:D-alanyl-D-alanine carboxypeptidase family protein n=1 Tax=Roseateles sp. TaxID=1971397 RepID=UPI0032668EF7
MPSTYEVTATALNLRAAPNTGASVLTVLRRGQTCVASGSAASGWLPVSYLQQSGHVWADYVRAVDGAAPTTTPPAAPAAGGSWVTLPSSPQTRLNDPAQLHPKFREALANLLAKAAAENRPFKLFEAFRTPERQAWLYEQGRTRPGGIVTKAKPWQSFHQFGLGADLVLFVNGQWTWSSDGVLAEHWRRLPELAAEVGLRSLSWEAPHVEWPIELRDAVGPELLASADDTWVDTLSSASARWRSSGQSGGPDLQPAQRPELANGPA